MVVVTDFGRRTHPGILGVRGVCVPFAITVFPHIGEIGVETFEVITETAGDIVGVIVKSVRRQSAGSENCFFSLLGFTTHG